MFITCECCGIDVDEGASDVIDGEEVCLDCLYTYYPEYARLLDPEYFEALEGDYDE